MFTHLTGKSLPSRAELRTTVIRSVLDPARLQAFEAKIKQQAQSRAAAQHAAQHAALERRLETRAIMQYGNMLNFARHLLERGYRLRKRRKGAVTVTDALSSDGKTWFPQLDSELRDWLQGNGVQTV